MDKLLKEHYDLTTKEYESYQTAFEEISINGKLSARALEKYLKENFPQLKPPNEYYRFVVEEVGKKNDVDLDAFLRYIVPICKRYQENYRSACRLFQMLDKDGDGYINCREFLTVLTNLKNTSMPEKLRIQKYRQEILKECENIDKNGDKKIDFSEFIEFLEKKQLL